MIRISNLCKIIKDRKILNNINLNLPSSGIVVLCGENGSGKTTLLNIIGMMDDNYDGDILFDEINYKSLNDSEKSLYREKCISYCFQKNNLISFLTAGQNRYLDKMLMNEKFDTVENQNVSNFSQGQQQSLAIFHLLKPGKRIYLLDEVTSCLDVNNTKRLIEDIRKLARESLIVIVSHNLELKDIADQVITLKKGEIIEEKIINFNDESQDDIKINDDRKFSWPLFLSYVKSVSIPAIFSLFINTLVYIFLFISIIGTTTAPRQALDPIYNDLTYVTTSISGGFNYDKLLEKYPNQSKKFVNGKLCYDKDSYVQYTTEIIFDENLGSNYVYLNTDYHNKLTINEKEYDIDKCFVTFNYNFYSYQFNLKIDDSIKGDGLYVNPIQLEKNDKYHPSVTIENGFWDTDEHYASYYQRYIDIPSPEKEVYGWPVYLGETYASELLNITLTEDINDDTLYIFDDRLYTDKVTFFEKQPIRTPDMRFNYNLASKFPEGVKIELLSHIYDSPNTRYMNFIIVSDNTFNKIVVDKPNYEGIYIDLSSQKSDIISFLSDKGILIKIPDNLYLDWSLGETIKENIDTYNRIIRYNFNFKSTFWCRVLLIATPFIIIIFQMVVSHFISYSQKQNNTILKKVGMKDFERFLFFNSIFILVNIIALIISFNLGMVVISPMEIFGFIPGFTLIDLIVSLLAIIATTLVQYITFKVGECV